MKPTFQFVVAGAILALSMVGTVTAMEPHPALGNARFSGQINSIYSYNFANPDSRTNTLRVFDAVANEFQVNLAELAVEGTAGERGGYRMDLAFGADANAIESSGAPNDDGFSLEQAYVTWALDKEKKFSLLGGKFVTLHGAEVIESASNLNTSRALAFGYAIPFTHTGLLASWQATEAVGVKIGLVNGWDNIKDNNASKTAHAMVSVVPNDAFSLSLGGSYGAEQTDNESNKRYIMDLLASYQITDAFKAIINVDLGGEEKANLVDGGNATWTAVAAYLHYARESCGLTIRGETFMDDGLSRMGVASGMIGTDVETGMPTVLIHADSLRVDEVTVTGHVYIESGLEFRPEFRTDFADQDIFLDSDGKPTDKQMTVSGELIYSF